MRRWINRWNAYWFPESSTLSLSISRIVAVAAQLFWFFPSLRWHLNLLQKNSEFIAPQVLISAISEVVPRDAFFTPSTFTFLYWATAAVGVLALVGLFTRPSVFLFALGSWIFTAHVYSYGDRHHPEAVFAIFLMTLAFAPSGDRLSLDALIRRRRDRSGKAAAEAPRQSDTATWPLKLTHVLLAMTYFSTGISKLIFGGLTWMNGYTLRGYTFANAVNREAPLGMWLAQQHTISILLSVFTVMFELFFFVSLIVPRTAPFFFFTGIMFQIGLFLTGRHLFFPHIVLLALLLVLTAPQWWRAWMGDAAVSSRPFARVAIRQ